MALHVTSKGVNLPIGGWPSQDICDGPRITRVGVICDDFPGMKPRVLVKEGDVVRRGQPLIEDRATPSVFHTAPGQGRVLAVNRGQRRLLQSIVIRMSDGETSGLPGEDAFQQFSTFLGSTPTELRRSDVVSLLTESGQWAALRTRPFGKVPNPESMPEAMFVTAIDTNPLAGDPEVVLATAVDDFEKGLRIVSKLTDGPTYLCVRPNSSIVQRVDAPVRVEEFEGPHPAGTVGYHVHRLRPVNRRHEVWTIGYQDVVSIARLFRTGRVDVSRVVSMGGPPVVTPRLMRTRVGASLADLAVGEDLSGNVRWISGSVFSGKSLRQPGYAFLGRYDVQLSAVRESGKREFLGWCVPGKSKFSVLPAFLSRILHNRDVEFTTNTHGSPRAIVPIGLYERVVPMDIMPTFLLRSLMVEDAERAEELGALELCEEDVALCTFVCPGKNDYGLALRKVLNVIEAQW